MIYFYDITYNDYFQTILLQPMISYTTPIPPPPIILNPKVDEAVANHRASMAVTLESKGRCVGDTPNLRGLGSGNFIMPKCLETIQVYSRDIVICPDSC